MERDHDWAHSQHQIAQENEERKAREEAAKKAEETASRIDSINLDAQKDTLDIAVYYRDGLAEGDAGDS